MKKLILSCSALLLLSACVSEQQADAKLIRGCEAAVKSQLGNATIKETKSVNASNETNIEGLHRRITIDTVMKDGWLELDKKYSCLFAQQWGLFKSSHSAMLIQLDMGDGKILGKKDGKIVGSMEQYMALVDKVGRAMNQ